MPSPRLISSCATGSAVLFLCVTFGVLAYSAQVAPQSSLPGEAQSENPKPKFAIIFANNAGLELEHRVNPVYPATARVIGITGNVVLEISVDADGSVSNVSVKSRAPLFHNAAIDAVHQWKFAVTPQLPSTATITMHFRLTHGEEFTDLESSQRDDISIGITGISDLYPEEAKRQGIEGQVGLEVTLGSNGQLSDYRVLKSDNELLTSAALQFLYNDPDKERLTPGRKRVVVNYELNHKYLDTSDPLPIVGLLTQAPADLFIMQREFALYPEQAQKEDIEGNVQIKLTLDQDGEVADAAIVSGPAALQEVALQAAKKWRFAPPSQAPVEVAVTYHFWVPN